MFKVDQIDHVELFVPDRFEAAKWYEKVLGLSIVERYKHWSEHPKGPLMVSSDDGSTKLALFTGTPQGTRETAGYHLVAFRVSGENFIRFLQRCDDELELINHNAEKLHSKLFSDHGQAFSIYFNDPFGHRLEITTYDHEFVRGKI